MHATPEPIGLDADAESIKARLCEEFPGWDIKVRRGSPSFQASRDGGHAGPITVGADSYGGLRTALDEVDRLDCRHAIFALRDALRARGLTAEIFGLTVSTETRTGILRVVAARHGVYSWTTGVELAPIDDPELAAERMLPGLGLA
ncbi:hypothetical protein ACQPZP_09540 [Spirillospora sp. CA-142024]|uniref:hypothetical protein n=1 Tax=Spirillospora sp. CA-142024 TaxID=3240036 RepID=UPI003D8DEC22